MMQAIVKCLFPDPSLMGDEPKDAPKLAACNSDIEGQERQDKCPVSGCKGHSLSNKRTARPVSPTARENTAS